MQSIATELNPADLSQAETHLKWWFGTGLADPQLGEMDVVLATIPGLDQKRNIGFHAFGGTTEAARWAVEKSALVNVYVHPATHAPHRPKGKGSTETALCLPGVVADLDAQSPYRGSNEGKAPDVASLRLVIADFEDLYRFPLTLIESGYGIYPCIRFREPLWLADRRTRTEAETLLARFTEGLRVFARQRGWPNTVDCVPLAGLIRVAGTLNRKGSPLLVHFADRNGGGE
jgi:hypothetical protein